jgi:hypothetical protein
MELVKAHSNDGHYLRDFRGRQALVWDVTIPRRKGWFGNLMEALSQFLAALIGAHANLTFSAQCGYWLSEDKRRGKVLVPIINWLFRDPLHCQKAWRDKV